MNKLTIKIATAVSSAALIVSSFATPLMATTVEISGNGSDSDNTVAVQQTNTTVVTQTNTANISNNIDIDANTGDNSAEDNTGGDVSIDTGDASATVGVSTTANSNQADVSGCCAGDTSIKVSGNGSDSDNKVGLKTTNNTVVTQNNDANISNDVDVDLDTGGNDAEDNTGGNVAIDTGDADATVTISNQANANWAAITAGPNGGGSLSVEVAGNGADSDNDVAVELASQKIISQNNNANISNDVEIDADTGDNEAEDNTGGDVEIDTGDATAKVEVSNMANFNAADLEGCGCVGDLDIKVKGNGAESDNEVGVLLGSVQVVSQDNNFNNGKECDGIDVDLDTGDNKAEDNTQYGGDPSITTGDADADVTVENTANSNSVGSADFGDWFPSVGGNSSLLVLLLALFA